MLSADGNGRIAAMKKKSLVVPALAALVPLLCSACAGNPDAHTYWLKNSTTGAYSAHVTYHPLSSDEIRELGLVEELPPDAKTIE